MNTSDTESKRVFPDVTEARDVPASVERRRRDRRPLVLAGGLLAILIVGAAVALLPGRAVVGNAPDASASGAPAPTLFPLPDLERNVAVTEQVPKVEAMIDPRLDPKGHERQAREIELGQRLAAADEAMDRGRFDQALAEARRAQALLPDSAKAEVRIGFALNGLGRYQEAFAHLSRAIDLDPTEAPAYFGMAVTQEGFGNLEGAVGAMRAFLHLTPDPDSGRLVIAQARAAIWEWESKLGRGPWGPTRGVPPGLTEAEIRRDGQGVGVKMPKGESQADGSTPYEIRSAEKTPLFSK